MSKDHGFNQVPIMKSLRTPGLMDIVTAVRVESCPYKDNLLKSHIKVCRKLMVSDTITTCGIIGMCAHNI